MPHVQLLEVTGDYVIANHFSIADPLKVVPPEVRGLRKLATSGFVPGGGSTKK